MKKALFFIFISILANYHISTLSAQVPTAPGNYQWVKGFGSVFQQGITDEMINAVKLDNEGNIVVCGRLMGYPHIQGLGGKKDSIITNRWQNSSNLSGFISKYDCNGNILWFKEINDSINGSEIYDFVIDSADNIYALGVCNAGGENVYFGDTLFSPFSFSAPTQGPAVLFGLNKNGGLIWNYLQPVLSPFNNYAIVPQSQNASGSPRPNMMFLHKDTISIIGQTGVAQGSITFGNVTIQQGKSLVRFTLQGNLVDAIRLDTTGYCTGFGIDKDGNYMAGFNFIEPTNSFLDSTFIRPNVSFFNQLSTVIKFNRSHVIRHIEFGDSTGAGAINFNQFDNSFNVLGGGDGKPIYGGYSTHLYTIPFGRIGATSVMNFNNLTTLNWGQCPDTTGGNRGFFSLASDVNKDVYAHIPFNDRLKFQNLSLAIPGAFRTVIVKLSKNNGTLLNRLPDLNTVLPNTSTNFIGFQNILLNETGNLFMSGNLDHNSVIAGTDTANYYGGQNDMFIIKYGNPCSNTAPLITAAAPIDVLAQCNTNNIKITWKDISTTEDKYYIYRSLSAASGYAKIDSVAANTTQYTDNLVQANTSYWYALSAHNAMGEGYMSMIDSSMLCGVGMDDATMNNGKLVVYPNPVSNVLICKCANMLINTIVITNVLGQQQNIKVEKLTTENCQLNTENLPSGIYFIKATDTNGNVMNGKFVKE